MTAISYLNNCADKRNKKYRDIKFIIDYLVFKNGKESAEVKQMLNNEIENIIGYKI